MLNQIMCYLANSPFGTPENELVDIIRFIASSPEPFKDLKIQNVPYLQALKIFLENY
jgi:hypothetical protein